MATTQPLSTDTFLEIAELLSLLARGSVPADLSDQAARLLEKMGEAPLIEKLKSRVE